MALWLSPKFFLFNPSSLGGEAQGEGYKRKNFWQRENIFHLIFVANASNSALTRNEKWVQRVIADDPSILGLGEVILKDAERVQPSGGRLDLLLYDPEANRRYEVELQLGFTDESHIIRTIEYWDYERRRYPQYEHCAVQLLKTLRADS